MTITIKINNSGSKGKLNVTAIKTDALGKEYQLLSLYGEIKASLDALHNVLKATLDA